MARTRKPPVWVNLGSILPSHERSEALRSTLARLLSDEGGETVHGRAGDTVAFLVKGLEEAGRPYQITALPGSFYKIRVIGSIPPRSDDTPEPC